MFMLLTLTIGPAIPPSPPPPAAQPQGPAPSRRYRLYTGVYQGRSPRSNHPRGRAGPRAGPPQRGSCCSPRCARRPGPSPVGGQVLRRGGLLGQSLKKPLLPFDAPDICRGPSPVAHVSQRLGARQLLGAGRNREKLAVLLRLYRLFDINRDPAEGIHYLPGPAKVEHHVVFYRELCQVLQGLYRQLWSTVRERGVHLVLSHARYLDQRISRDREQPAGSCDHARV